MKKFRKPKVKLLTLWMLDQKYESNKVSDFVISNGIWETYSVEEKFENNDKQRVYTLICVNSNHRDLKIGDKKKMTEVMIIELCHRVKIVHLPKYKSLLKNDTKNYVSILV